MDSRGEFVHSIRNPLAAVDANLLFLKEVCDDMGRFVEAMAGPRDALLWAELDPPRLIREAREALGDSAQAIEQIRGRLSEWAAEK